MAVYRLYNTSLGQLSERLYNQVNDLADLKTQLWNQYLILCRLETPHKYWLKSRLETSVNNLDKQIQNLDHACAFLNEAMRLTNYYDNEVSEKIKEAMTIFENTCDIIMGGVGGKYGVVKDIYKLGKGAVKKDGLKLAKAGMAFEKMLVKSAVRSRAIKGLVKGSSKAIKVGDKAVESSKLVKGCTAVTTLLSGLINLKTNLEEQEASHGRMSTGRVIAETIGETLADIGVQKVIEIGIGAALTPILGTGAVAVVAAGALTVGATLLLDHVVKKVTKGKKNGVGELISDFVLDKIGPKAKKISGTKCSSGRVRATLWKPVAA